MHAFLIIGSHEEAKRNKAEEIAKKLKAKIFEFPLSKIDDVRELNSFTSFRLTVPTAIYINSIEGATEEALNAFLKNLEEPQENLYYVLTASSARKVLPTIVSRCQIIKIPNDNSEAGYSFQMTNEKKEEIQNFLNYSVGEKLTFLDKIKERQKAIEFMEDFIFSTHQSLHSTNHNYSQISNNLLQALSTLKALKANGNMVLQLTNFVINLGN